MIRRLLRAVFYTGRHHVHTAKRGPDGRGLVTVSTIAAQLRREARERAYGSAFVEIRADVEALSPTIRQWLDSYRAG